ncbi:mediator of DNA damage checkpoint protein 1-like isoform X3 [Dreissena polymorpha]|uniref:mediator of DNA damage checkpoint protein 1-like isoform X3 n=1 Tax=Dreissena polymorpha TaxID=45954 RepID=UPI0022647E27|nr:mediator of DNA damage checkpoint protein 1-like isoform X3 [Dreissena polymorpha]
MEEGGIEATQALPFDDYDDDATDDEDPDRPAAYLNVPLQKGFHGKQFPLFEGDNIIGRSEECKICIPLKGLSREHACIEVHGTSHFIYDKGSRNRTRRNKHFLAASVRYELKDNDQLVFGDVESEYKLNSFEASDDQFETGSMDQFQTAPNDDTSGEPDKPPADTEEDGFESDASSDILEPSQKFASGTQSMLKSISMLGDKTIGQNITVKETPMQSRTKRFIEDIVLPESGSDTEGDEESLSRPPATLIVADSQDDSVGERSALLAAPTQAYVCDSDVTTDDDEDSSMAGKRSLLMAPTQAFVQEDSDISTCSEASPVKRSMLTAATQAYVLDSDTDMVTMSPAKRSLLFEPTQAYNMEAGIEPTVGYDMKGGSDKLEESGSHLMFEPTQAYPGVAADEDEEDAQSDSSEEFVLEGDTDTEDNMDPNIMGAATLAVDTQGMDDTVEDNDATVPVEDETQAVAADKEKDTKGGEHVEVAETQMIDSDTSPTKSSRRQGPANADDATQVIIEGEETGTNEGKVDNQVYEMETQVIMDEATQVLDGGKGIGMKTEGHPNVSVDNIAETQVFDESTLAVYDVKHEAKPEQEDDGLDIDATQVIEENHASENRQNTQCDRSNNLATQVFQDTKHCTQTVVKKKLSKDHIGDGETQAFSDADMVTFDINAVSTLAMEADISVPVADNDVAEKYGVDATQVFDDATVAVTDDTTETSQKKTSRRATKNICDDATQVLEDVTVVVNNDANEQCNKLDQEKTSKNISDDSTQVFEEATVSVTDVAVRTSKKQSATKTAKKKMCDDATQVFNDVNLAVADETIEPYTTKTIFTNIGAESTQVFDDATVAVADDTDEIFENKAVTKCVEIPGLDQAMAIDKVLAEKQPKSKKGVKKKVNKKEMENTEKPVDEKSELDAETQVFDEVTLSLQESPKGENKPGKEKEGMGCYDANQIVEEKAHVDFDRGVNTGAKRKRGGKLNETANTITGSEHITEKLDNTRIEKEDEKNSNKRPRKANAKINKESAIELQNEEKNALLIPDAAPDTSANIPTKRGRAAQISQNKSETKDSKNEIVDGSTGKVKECSEETVGENIKLGRGQRARSKNKKFTETEVETNKKQIGKGKGKKTVEKKLVQEPAEVEVKSRRRRGTPGETDGSTEQAEAEEFEHLSEAAETQVYASESETEATQKYEMDDDDATPDINKEDSTPTVPVVVVSLSKTALKSALASPKRKLSPSPKRVAFKSQSSAGSNSSQETKSRRSRVKVTDEKAETSNQQSLEPSIVASTRRGSRRSLAVDKLEPEKNVEDTEADHNKEPVGQTATRSKRGKSSRKTKGDNAGGETESISTEADFSVKEVDKDEKKMDVDVPPKGVVSKRGSRSNSDQKGVDTGTEATENGINGNSVDKSNFGENTTGVKHSRLVKSKVLHSSKGADAEPSPAERSKDSQELNLVCDESKVLKNKKSNISKKGNNVDTDVKQDQSCLMDKPVNSRRKTRNNVEESLNLTQSDNPNIENTSEDTKVPIVTKSEILHNDTISCNKGRTKSARNNKDTLQATFSSQVDNNRTTSRNTRRKIHGENESTECDADSVVNRTMKKELNNPNERQEDDAEQGKEENVKDSHSKGDKGKGRKSGIKTQKTEIALDENSTNASETNAVRIGRRENTLEQEESKEVETGTVQDKSVVSTTVSEASVGKRGTRGRMQEKVEAASDESIVNTSGSGSEINKRGRREKKADPDDEETQSKPDESSANITVTGASEARRVRKGKKVDSNEKVDFESKVKVEVANEVSDPEAFPLSGKLKRKESDNDSQASLEEKPGKRRKTTLDPAETPKHKNKRLSAVCTPSGKDMGPDSTVTSSPALRKSTTDGQKARVMFTGVLDEQGEKVVKELGGELVTSAAECTHLVTDQVRRTVKFLCCLSLGRPIVTPQWLVSSKNSAFFTDDASEKKYKFTLHLSLDKARSKPLLEGYSVHVTKSVKPPPDQMNEILKCAGAKVLSSMPKTPQPLTVVVSCPEDNSVCDVAVKAGVRVVSSEFVLTGVLRQEVDLDAHALFAVNQGFKRMTLNTSTMSEPGGKKRRK